MRVKRAADSKVDSKHDRTKLSRETLPRKELRKEEATKKKKNRMRYRAALPKSRLMERERERGWGRERGKDGGLGKEVEGLFRKQLGNG